MAFLLRIVSPERVEFEGEVKSVTVPGTLGRFEILINHAPIISSLEDGTVTFEIVGGETKSLDIHAGFVSVKQNKVDVCVEK